MANKIYAYLLPVYLVGVFGVIIFFFTYFISLGNRAPNPIALGLLLAGYFLAIILGMAFTAYMAVDCALRKMGDAEKALWVLLIYLFNIIGATIYYYVVGMKPRGVKR